MVKAGNWPVVIGTGGDASSIINWRVVQFGSQANSNGIQVKKDITLLGELDFPV